MGKARLILINMSNTLNTYIHRHTEAPRVVPSGLQVGARRLSQLTLRNVGLPQQGEAMDCE